jgi:hypothetical protein
MSYLRPIPQPRCKVCQAAAKVELMNRVNGHVGYYCTAHGKRALREHERSEQP